METKLDRVRKQLSLGKLRQRLASHRSNSEGGGMTSEDEDHLLENSEPINGSIAAFPPAPDCNGRLASLKADARRTLCSSTSYDGSTSEVTDNNGGKQNRKSLDDSEIDKYQIPSSIIVLNEEEKKKLEAVLLHMGMAEVGLA